MALEIPEKLSRDEWEKLPDAQKPIFRQVENDPNTYEYGVPQMFSSMKNAKAEREAERKAREAAEAAAAAYKKFGDPAFIEDLVQREGMIKEGTKNLEDAIMKANRDAEEKWRGVVDESKKAVSRLEADRKSDHQSNIIRSLVLGSGVDPEYADEVMLSFGRQLKTELRDGRPVTYVIDPNNPNELAKDPETFDPMTPEKAFQLFRSKKGKFFKGESDGHSGGGFEAGRGGGGDAFDTDPLTWDFATKKAYFDANGANAQAGYNKKLQAWDAKRQQKKAS